MLAGSQVTSGTHAGIYLRPSDIVWQPRRAADTSTKLATEPFLLLHHEHGTGYQRSWNYCDRRTCFVVIWKHFCFILSTGIKIWIDSVICPWFYSRGRNTSASVTVTVSICSGWHSGMKVGCQTCDGVVQFWFLVGTLLYHIFWPVAHTSLVLSLGASAKPGCERGVVYCS